MPTGATKNQLNIFDPTKQAGFFRTIGRASMLSAQAPKTLQEKQNELTQSVLNELKHSTKILKQATGT